MIFTSTADKELLLTVFRQAKRKFHFQIFNFCIMNNHIHLLIKPGLGESLSKIMQWILSVFAMRWNRKHCLTGHVWGARFFSRIIEGILDYLKTFLYLDDNPVRARMVERPEQWRYGGLWHHKTRIGGIVEAPSRLIRSVFPDHEPAVPP
jgi:putative transposase